MRGARRALLVVVALLAKDTVRADGPWNEKPYGDWDRSEGTNPCFPALDPVNNPADRTYGLHRNTLRGPHQTNFDLALAKTTAITESANLELRVEYFNVLNHPEFAIPDANPNSPTFGQITSTGTFRGPTPRIGQLAAKLTFWSFATYIRGNSA